MQARDTHGRFIKQPKVAKGTDAAEASGSSQTIRSRKRSSRAITVTQSSLSEAEADNIIAKWLCCNPLLPWSKQTTSQSGLLQSVFRFTKCFTGYKGIISPIVVAGTAALPHSFKDELLVEASGSPIGRGSSLLLEQAILVKISGCKFCAAKKVKVCCLLLSAQTHRPRAQQMEKAMRCCPMRKVQTRFTLTRTDTRTLTRSHTSAPTHTHTHSHTWTLTHIHKLTHRTWIWEAIMINRQPQRYPLARSTMTTDSYACKLSLMDQLNECQKT